MRRVLHAPTTTLQTRQNSKNTLTRDPTIPGQNR